LSLYVHAGSFFSSESCKKKQVVAVLVAVIGIGIVFSLPKVLVDNKKETVEGAEAGASAVSNKDSLTEMGKLMAEKHTHKPSGNEQKKIQDFTKNYYSISDKEKKAYLCRLDFGVLHKISSIR